jgi:hypothetical protein
MAAGAGPVVMAARGGTNPKSKILNPDKIQKPKSKAGEILAPFDNREEGG